MRLTLIGVVLSAIALASAYSYFYRNTWHTDSFYINTYNEHIVPTISNNTIVIWKWSAPIGLDGQSHYITAVIKSTEFNSANVGNEFRVLSNCYDRSGGARKFLGENSELKCWSKNSGVPAREIALLYAREEGLILYKLNRR